MSAIYYNNSGTLTPLTYADFGAAAADHQHSGSSISGVFPISRGGTGVSVSSYNNNDGIFYATSSGNSIQLATPSAAGIFGYFNGADTGPGFGVWPLMAGGTGYTTRQEVQNAYKILASRNSNSAMTISLTNWVAFGFLTNSKKRIQFSLPVCRPLQQPIDGGSISLCPQFWQNTSRSKAAAIGLADNRLSSDTTKETVSGKTSQNCVNRRIGFTVNFSFDTSGNDYDTQSNTGQLNAYYSDGDLRASNVGSVTVKWTDFGTISSSGYRLGYLDFVMDFNNARAISSGSINTTNNAPVIIRCGDPTYFTQRIYLPISS